MNALALMGGLAGGVGLFLLGMGLMTDGLKLAAGPALERILANSTETRLRALASGVAVTALVQSSSAVTVAAIGCVNAGLLNLSQALWVLFGANVGTTMTGWLVALVGLKFKIEALALPLIGVGMILRLSGERDRRSALGMALAGFGVLFLGIDMLKDTFSGLSTDFNLPAGTSVRDVLVLVLIGIVLTVLMQSSSASLAVALTAAQGGLIAAEGAAAVVIGANVGTTVTALLAAIGATANAKRAAAAHILFNLLTGVVALLLLPWLVTLLGVLRARLHLEAAPAAEVALFHSVFNVLGVVLIWPWATRLTRLLQTRFRSIEEEAGRPRFIDRTVLAVPALALDALAQEIRHLGQLSLATLRAAIEDNDPPRAADARARQPIMALNTAIADFIVQLNRSGMTPTSAARLPALLRLARQYESAAELAAEARAAGGDTPIAKGGSAPEARLRDSALRLLAMADPDAPAQAASRDTAFLEMQDAYEALKAHWLAAGAAGRLPVLAMDAHLRAASALRRALEQATRAAQSQDPAPPLPGSDQGNTMYFLKNTLRKPPFLSLEPHFWGQNRAPWTDTPRHREHAPGIVGPSDTRHPGRTHPSAHSPAGQSRRASCPKRAEHGEGNSGPQVLSSMRSRMRPSAADATRHCHRGATSSMDGPTGVSSLFS
jgi:phosphate:Na+ symporter